MDVWVNGVYRLSCSCCLGCCPGIELILIRGDPPCPCVVKKACRDPEIIPSPDSRGSVRPGWRESRKRTYKGEVNPYSAKGLGDRLYATLHKMPGEDDYSFCLFLKSKNSPLYTSGSHFVHSTPRSKLSLLNHFPIYYRLLKNKYTIQFLWMARLSRFATAILSGETELALGTIRVKLW